MQMIDSKKRQKVFIEMHYVFVTVSDVVTRKSRSSKGQLISKWFFGFIDFLQKITNELDFTTMIPQVELFLLVSLENYFRVLLTFRKV